MATVFDTIVLNENDHTNLLRSVMERHPNIAAEAMTILIDREVSELEAGYLLTRTQHSFRHPGGRSIPDISIRGRDGLYCLVEAKVDPSLPLSPEQLQGYRHCFPSSGERYLSFLLPQDYGHRDMIAQVGLNLSGSGIRVISSNWQVLIKRIDEVSKQMKDEVLSEAISFWRWRFGVIAMTEEERRSLSNWPHCRYSALKQVEKTLDQAKKLFDAKGFQTELETSVREYGFYVKRGERYLVWTGMWDGFAKPLACGYKRAGAAWIAPTTAMNGAVEFNGYDLLGLDAACWDSPERLYEAISAAIHEHWPA